MVLLDPCGALSPVLGGSASPLLALPRCLESRPARDAPPALARKLGAGIPLEPASRITQSRWEDWTPMGNVLPLP